MPGKETDIYILPSGAQIEFETVLSNRRGVRDVSKGNEKDKIPFEKVIEPLGEFSQLLFEKLKSSVKEPDSVSLEFGASIKGGTNLLIVGSSGEGSIKVKLTWENSDKNEHKN